MGLYTSVQSQNRSIRIAVSNSKLFKHSQKSLFSVPERSYTAEVSLLYATDEKYHWQRYFGQPRIGINLIYTDFGDPDVLGRAIGLYPSIEYFFTKSSKFNAAFQLGVGIAKLNRYYDINNNPLNNAIGSGWNNVSKLSFHLEHIITGPWHVHTNLYLTHYSNAGTQMPNLGLNIIGVGAGVLRKFDNKMPLSAEKEEDLQQKNKFGIDLMAGVGISEYAIPGGPKLPTQYAALSAYGSFSPFLRLYTGFEYEYSESVFQFYYQDFESRQKSKERATSTSVYLTTELMHDRFAFRFQKGVYLPFPEFTRDKSPIYFKLHLITYAGNQKWKVRPYGGVLLKTHFTVAQYMGLVFGLRY